MRSILFCIFALFALTLYSEARPRPRQVGTQTAQAPQRDPQAIGLVQRAVKAMGGSAPADSTATGTINLVAGSQNENGTITIQTLGTGQTFEQITLPSGQRSVTYSNGQAAEGSPSSSGPVVMQLAVTDQCPDFPLPLLIAALNNPDSSFHFVGQETVNGAATQHVQVWNSFASKPTLAKLAAFSIQDIWLEASSGLPVKIGYTRRAAGGAAPSIPVEVYFSNYANTGGALYPMQIKKSYNGTPWQTITIQNVAFNTGLTAAQFQVQ